MTAPQAISFYRTGRSGMSTYRFDVPNGQLCGRIASGRDSPAWTGAPCLRRNGGRIGQFLGSLDLYALAQHDYAIRFALAANLQGWRARRFFLQPPPASLSVCHLARKRAPDNQSPAAPTTIHAVGGYRQAIIRWSQVEEDDVERISGLSRTVAGQTIQMVTPEPVRLARFFDDAATVGRSYCYTVSAVDLFGNEGPRSSIACAAVVNDDAAHCRFSIWLSPRRTCTR